MEKEDQNDYQNEDLYERNQDGQRTTAYQKRRTTNSNSSMVIKQNKDKSQTQKKQGNIQFDKKRMSTTIQFSKGFDKIELPRNKSLFTESLKEDILLPDDFDVDKVVKAEKNFCQLCRQNNLGTITNWSHHCRRCGKTVCSKCGNNKRHLSKKDQKTKYRICDQCDAILQNYRLQQNQQQIIDAQKDQIMMMNDSIMMKTDEYQKLHDRVSNMSKERDQKMKQLWDMRTKLEEELQQLRLEADSLNYNKNNLNSEIINNERILKDKQQELQKLVMRKNQQQQELNDQEKILREKEQKNEELQKQLNELKEIQGNPQQEQSPNNVKKKGQKGVQERLDIQRSQKMKYYLDSVGQHRIDETNSEQNSSFISMEQQKRQSIKGRFQSKQAKILENVNEEKEERIDPSNNQKEIN